MAPHPFRGPLARRGIGGEAQRPVGEVPLEVLAQLARRPIAPGRVGLETAAEDFASDLDLTDMTVTNTRGTPTSGGPPEVFLGSNVVAVLYGASEEVSTKVQTAIEGLP